MSGDYIVRSFARSHIGSVRTVNEDRVLNLGERRLWAVADGMGGHAMGDVAAQIAVETLAGHATSALTSDRLTAALTEANDRVLEVNRRSGEQCGSTIAGLSLLGSDALIFWAGDSRVYRLRAGDVALLTHDHRVVQDLVDARVIAADQAKHHPRAAVITRAIGAGPTLEPVLRHEAAESGDVYLVCSDGLSDLVEDAEMAPALATPDDAAADRLLRAALDAGGTDNISFVIVALETLRAVADQRRADDMKTKF